MFRVAHFSDLHYSPKNEVEADYCCSTAVSEALDMGVDAAVISGDLFDHRVQLDAPCVYSLRARVQQLAEKMPVLILQGTFSHDYPGSLNIFRNIHGVRVADRIMTLSLREGGNGSLGWARRLSSTDAIMFHCLPSIDKGAVAARLEDKDDVDVAAGERVASLMRAWGREYAENAAARVVVSHGTVNGCITEHGVPMAGMDHEFSTAALALSGADAVMLGHIHKHQWWWHGDTLIAYPGSIGRYHFGEKDPKGWLLWTLPDTRNHDLLEEDERAAVEFIETPSRKLVEMEFDGAPDLKEVERAIVENGPDADYRVRWSIDEERRHEVDRERLESLFSQLTQGSGRPVNFKLQGRVIPKQRQRAKGISEAESISGMLERWCEATDHDFESLEPLLREVVA